MYRYAHYNDPLDTAAYLDICHRKYRLLCAIKS
jgi:hypothetical protein